MAGPVAALQAAFAEDRHELERSEKVQRQLQEVLAMLAARSDGLGEACARCRAEAGAEARTDAGCQRMELEVHERRLQRQAAADEQQQLLDAVAEQRRSTEQHEQLVQQRRAAAAELVARAEALERGRREAEGRREEASARARSMVAGTTLDRVSDDCQQLRRRVADQEAEGARLRQALMDSWAARADVDESQPQSALQDLDGVEEELRWLARLQQESTAETHRTQSLERQEAVLQAKIRELAEEKASLQSARVDLGTAGGTLRETIASQSEGWVRRVDELEKQKRVTDQDRVKLLNESADLQARLDAIAPELDSIQELERRHAGLEEDRRQSANESSRLRDVNGALGVMLLGNDAPPAMPGESAGSVAEALTRTLQLLLRLNERTDAQALEKEKLMDRIRELERHAAQPGADDERHVAPPARATAAAAAAGAARGPAATGGSMASVSGALRGGLGRLRDAATNAVL